MSVKYECGNVINDWVVVSILTRKKGNRKILCYNKNTGIFKEGWVTDFVRDLISDSPNRKPICKLCTMCFVDYTKKELYDINSDYTFKQHTLSKNLSTSDLITLRNIREGIKSGSEVVQLLQKFSTMLAKSGQHRRNTGLSIVIGSTYEILFGR